MRHYGAPVRLIDWTYSYFVAAYFSFFRVIKKNVNRKYGIWAINDSWLGKTVQQKILFPSLKSNKKLQKYINEIKEDGQRFTFKDPELFEKVYFDQSLPFVHSFNPFHLNDRLIIQQGLFLCPGDITKSFEENLTSVFDKSDKKDVSKNFQLILFENENAGSEDKETDANRKKIMKILNRMNINQATLFPGLQGFAESLIEYANFPDILRSEGSEMIESYRKYLKPSS